MTPADLVRAIAPGAFDAWISEQRWFASKARELVRVEVLDAVTLRDADPAIAVALVEAIFQAGTHERYQLPLVLRPAGSETTDDALALVDGWAVSDAVGDPEAAVALGRLVTGESAPPATGGPIVFAHQASITLGADARARPIDAEQSNSSVIFGDQLILKCYRRLEAGESPELEMLRFLADHGFPHMPELAGWYAYGAEAMDATLGVAQRYVDGARDGWEHTLDRLAESPDGLVGELAELGRIVGELHSVLASDTEDPDFVPEEKRGDMLDLAIATIDEEIREAFAALPDDARLAPIAGRGADLSEHVAATHRLEHLGSAIRLHGDLHLGQALLGADGRWMLLDFEGEPARPLRERRRKRSALRDVAALLRSVSYAVAAAELQGTVAPADWETTAREAILAAYLETVDRTLLPTGEDATRRLLSLFELEKAVYELRYELNHRPDWVVIPVAAIARILEVPPA